MEQVRAVEDGREIPAVTTRAKSEVVNYFAALRFVEKNSTKKTVSHVAAGFPRSDALYYSCIEHSQLKRNEPVVHVIYCQGKWSGVVE